MAIDPSAKYPGQIDTTTDPDGYPYGQAQNVQVAGDGIGTPLEKDWVNDFFGFVQAVLNEGGIVPSGTPEKVGGSQLIQALDRIYGRSPGEAIFQDGFQVVNDTLANLGDNALHFFPDFGPNGVYWLTGQTATNEAYAYSSTDGGLTWTTRLFDSGAARAITNPASNGSAIRVVVSEFGNPPTATWTVYESTTGSVADLAVHSTINPGQTGLSYCERIVWGGAAWVVYYNASTFGGRDVDDFFGINISGATWQVPTWNDNPTAGGPDYPNDTFLFVRGMDANPSNNEVRAVFPVSNLTYTYVVRSTDGGLSFGKYGERASNGTSTYSLRGMCYAPSCDIWFLHEVSIYTAFFQPRGSSTFEEVGAATHDGIPTKFIVTDDSVLWLSVNGEGSVYRRALYEATARSIPSTTFPNVREVGSINSSWADANFLYDMRGGTRRILVAEPGGNILAVEY